MSFSPDTVPVYCVCCQPYNPDRPMIECASCGECLHRDCAGVSEWEDSEHVVERGGYLCPSCEMEAGGGESNGEEDDGMQKKRGRKRKEYTRTGRKRRPKKDPNAPKRAPTAYNLFHQDFRKAYMVMMDIARFSRMENSKQKQQ